MGGSAGWESAGWPNLNSGRLRPLVERRSRLYTTGLDGIASVEFWGIKFCPQGSWRPLRSLRTRWNDLNR